MFSSWQLIVRGLFSTGPTPSSLLVAQMGKKKFRRRLKPSIEAISSCISNPALQDKRGLKSKLAEKASMLLSNLSRYLDDMAHARAHVHVIAHAVSREQGCARKVHAQMIKAGYKVFWVFVTSCCSVLASGSVFRTCFC